MAWMAGLAIVFILGLSLGLGILLVVLVRREGAVESGLGWEDAERVARRDGDESSWDGDESASEGDESASEGDESASEGDESASEGDENTRDGTGIDEEGRDDRRT